MLTLKVCTIEDTFSFGENIRGTLWYCMEKLENYCPLYYGENKDDWFYPVGKICCKENGEVIDFVMDDIKVFSFPCTVSEVKLNFLPEMKFHQNSNFVYEAGDFVGVWLHNHVTGRITPGHYSIMTWKEKVKNSIGTDALLYYNYQDLEGTVRKVRIFLDRSEALSSIDAIPDATSTNDASVCYYVSASKNISELRVKAFMFISTETPKAEANDVRGTVRPTVLQSAFEKSISSTGHDSIDYVKAIIYYYSLDWKHPNTKKNAPIASLSQGSGSGKSKLAVETIKDGPGLYCVFRKIDKDQLYSGYPRQNTTLSDRFRSLLSVSDEVVKLTQTPYNSVGIGRILMTIASNVTAYLQEWVTRVAKFRAKFPDDPIEVSVRSACAEIAHMFDNNDLFDCGPLLDGWEEAIVRKISVGTSVPSVESVAAHIKNILSDPLNLACKEKAPRIEEDVLTVMKQCLNSFPFLYIFDEADELDAEPSSAPYSRLQILRRALSYLIPGTNIFFLTLGTKSDIHDLNPPLIENSGRFEFRTETFHPIILLSNTSIFSKTDLPLEKLVINHRTITNPVMFKYFAAYGHPIWCSIPFDRVVECARMKIMNGTGIRGLKPTPPQTANATNSTNPKPLPSMADVFREFNQNRHFMSFVLVVWMIRAGMMANPVDLNTRTLIASHMATLFDLSPDLVKMVVFYPSEPVLAMACRKLITEELRNKMQISLLFSKLDEFFEAIEIDQGNLIEIIGSMLALLAVDLAKGEEKPCSTLDHLRPLVEEMVTDNPEFEWLWRKKEFALEIGAVDDAFTCTSFPYYHVVTVESFLSQLLGAEQFADIKADLPEATLKGIVNASHAVKVVRTGSEAFKFGDTTFEPMKLPVADDRITDKNCNLIDESMLKLGLAQQCMFLMPANYFAYDLIIPLVLEDGSVSFIGIQFKSNSKSIAKVVNGMQARFHYVKCPKAGVAGHQCSKCAPARCASFAEPDHSCPSCTDFNRLASLYASQISLFIGLDSFKASDFSESFKVFWSDSKDASRDLSAPEQILNNCLTKPVDEIEAALQTIEQKSKFFFKPLVEKRKRICSQEKLLLISSLWRDASVQLICDHQEVPFKSDHFVHRQHCIAIRGIDQFIHLFLQNQDPLLTSEADRQSANNALMLANQLINNSPHFFQRFNAFNDQLRQLSMMKAVLYDARLNYLDYNYELARMRGFFCETEDGAETEREEMNFGYPLLLKEARSVFKNLIIDEKAPDWANFFSSSFPSKSPTTFHRLPHNPELFRWTYPGAYPPSPVIVEAGPVSAPVRAVEAHKQAVDVETVPIPAVSVEVQEKTAEVEAAQEHPIPSIQQPLKITIRRPPKRSSTDDVPQQPDPKKAKESEESEASKE